MTVVWGPGHGAPGVLSGLYLEGSMTRFYPEYDLSKKGLDKFIKAFSFPGGFPSHINAETPGQIHEGGELGYALAVAYGSVMDNPDLITVAMIGDGESETGRECSRRPFDESVRGLTPLSYSQPLPPLGTRTSSSTPPSLAQCCRSCTPMASKSRSAP